MSNTIERQLRRPMPLPQPDRVADLAVGDCMIWRPNFTDLDNTIPPDLWLLVEFWASMGRGMKINRIPLNHGHHRHAYLVTRTA